MEEEKKDINKDEVKAIQKKQIRIVMIIFAIIIAIILIISGVVGIVSNINEKKKQEQITLEESQKVTVPNVVGKTYKEAREELEKLGLKVDAKLGNLEDDNIVRTQDPSAEERIKKGETVTVYLKIPVTVKSDNFYGMRFRKTISEFCEDYNIKLEKVYEQEGLDKVTMTLHTLDKSKFSLMNKVNTENGAKFNQYGFTGLNYYMFLFTEPNSENIVYACISYDTKGVSDVNGLITFITRRIHPAMIMTLTDFSYTTVLDNLKIVTSEKSYSYFKDNVAYSFYVDGTFYHNYVYAMSEEKYNAILNGNTSNNQTSDNSAIKTDIQDRIEFFNSYYAWNFHPTDEQMQQMVEFANTTSNLTNDTLADFIIDKGWLPDSETGTTSNNSSSTTSNKNNNSSSSNKNTSSSSNNNNTNKEVIATLNINIKDLIANSTDEEVKTIMQSNTLQVSIFVENSEEESQYLMYYGGANSIPNTITEKFTFITTSKLPTAKGTVKVVIDNTSTMIRESTLFEKEMTFDKTGTYTIK